MMYLFFYTNILILSLVFFIFSLNKILRLIKLITNYFFINNHQIFGLIFYKTYTVLLKTRLVNNWGFIILPLIFYKLTNHHWILNNQKFKQGEFTYNDSVFIKNKINAFLKHIIRTNKITILRKYSKIKKFNLIIILKPLLYCNINSSNTSKMLIRKSRFFNKTKYSFLRQECKNIVHLTLLLNLIFIFIVFDLTMHWGFLIKSGFCILTLLTIYLLPIFKKTKIIFTFYKNIFIK